MTKCFSYIRGHALRATKLDGCGNVVPGSLSQVVTEGFIEVGVSPQTEEGEAIQVTNAAGRLCINDVPSPTFTGFEIEATFCDVDPTLFSIMTGQPVVYDGATVPEIVGFDVNSDVDLDGQGFSLELWTGVPTSACEPGEEQYYGYLVIPFIKGGVLGDFTIENGAINFQVTGAVSKDGSGWGVGPYDVVLDDATPSPLLTALSTKNHLRTLVTQVPPPTGSCGAQPLGTEALEATEVSGGAATIPANTYPPASLVDANTVTLMTADPATAWDEGSYVTFEDGSIAHWNGTTWVVGAAPA